MIRSREGRRRGANRQRLGALLITALSAGIAVTCSTRRAPPRAATGTPGAEAGAPASAAAHAGERTAASAAPPDAGSRPGPLQRFLAGLRGLEQPKRRTRHLRILWVGDSHGAADMWTGPLRASLQKRFGNGGPGFVHVGYKAYRHEGVRTEASGKWAMRPKNPATSEPTPDGTFGLGGMLLRGYEDQPRASVSVDGEPGTGKLSWDLCYRMDQTDDELTVTLGNGPRTTLQSGGEPPGLRHLTLSSAGPTTLRVVPSGGRPELCGVVIETDPRDRAGVVLDTLGINGARCKTALAWNEEGWGAEVARRSPELVVLQYGTNEASDPHGKPATYARALTMLVERVRRIAPEADCVVVGPTDRADAEERMGSVRDAFRDAARSAGCWFWDTYEAMGGRGGARRWQSENPPRVARDGIHLTAKGYRELGLKLYADWMAELEGGASPMARATPSR